MKTGLCILLLNLFAITIHAQHIGVNNNDPLVSLDVNGALALRTNATIQELNQPISVLDLTNSSYVRFVANNGMGDNPERNIKLSAGVPGQIVTIEFTGTGRATLINGSKHSGGGKVLLASDMIFQFNTMILSLVFVNNNWRELYRTGDLPNETDTLKVTYNSTGIWSFTVPPGIQQLRVTVQGAGGWGGGSFGGNSGTGGRGGRVVCSFNTTEGQQYEVGIGQGGALNLRGEITYIKSVTTFLAIAGAGGNGSRNGGVGGAGGPSGGNGIIGLGATGTSGGGGNQIAGGAGGNGNAGSGQAGSALAGGTISTFNQGEGFGGNGWFGGGASGAYTSGSGSNPWASGGGGGGSNYVHPSVVTILNNNQGAVGGFGNSIGVKGFVTIEWY